MSASDSLPRVIIGTPFGDITVAIDTANAPITAANFLAYVDNDLFKDQTIYRIVAMHNQSDELPAKIEVIQFGHMMVGEGYPAPLPHIAHEPTSTTSLHHRDGTISMARFAPGSASSGFFICVGDQPELDEGGKRQPDGQGFAAFGQVVEGMDVVRAVHARSEASDALKTPIPLTGVRRA